MPGCVSELMLSNELLMKQAVADNFSKAACRYDEKARIQQTISDVAMKKVSALASNRDKRWQYSLDIGCGTGRVTSRLHQYCHKVTGVDLSAGMIRYAKREYAVNLPDSTWLIGDAEDLPVAGQSYDFVFSCMALQWLTSPEKVAAECFRIVSPGGEGLLAVLADGSLSELTRCWQILNVKPPVNNFLSGDNWLKSFENVGFKCDLTTETFVDLHNNVFSLLHSIKDIGAGGLMHSDGVGHLNKSKLIALNEIYKSHYLRDGQLPLSYKVGFLRIQKPFPENID